MDGEHVESFEAGALGGLEESTCLIGGEGVYFFLSRSWRLYTLGHVAWYQTVGNRVLERLV
jgi:hypothetical protein